MTKFESSVKVIPYSQERVYVKLSDLNNLETVKERLPKEQVKDLSFDSDTLSFNVPAIGLLSLKIIEREPCGNIKFETANSPLPFHLWIQLEATSSEECKIKIIVEMEINPFMKAMIQKPLQEGLGKMIEMLSSIQY